MDIPYCPHDPVLHQERWLARREPSYTFVSGHGGGKSQTLLMAALQDIKTPDYRAVIFYTSAQVMRWWQDKVDHWWEDDPRLTYHSQGSWVFPGGSMLQLRVFPTAGKAEQYRTTKFEIGRAHV